MLGLWETVFLKWSLTDLMDSRSRFAVLPQPVPVSKSITSSTEQHRCLIMLQSSRSARRKTQPVLVGKSPQFKTASWAKRNPQEPKKSLFKRHFNNTDQSNGGSLFCTMLLFFCLFFKKKFLLNIWLLKQVYEQSWKQLSQHWIERCVNCQSPPSGPGPRLTRPLSPRLDTRRRRGSETKCGTKQQIFEMLFFNVIPVLKEQLTRSLPLVLGHRRHNSTQKRYIKTEST